MNGRKLYWETRFDRGVTIHKSGRVTGKGRYWTAAGRHGIDYVVTRDKKGAYLDVAYTAFFGAHRSVIRRTQFDTVADARRAAQTREDSDT